MSEVIRQAAAAHHYLAVFDDHTECPLYLGRSHRLASTAQRIVLYARDRGCTFPGCTAPAYHSEVHHSTADWADGGRPTDIDEVAGLRPPTTASSNPAAGGPENAKTAAPNGSHRRTSIPAKPASTTITTCATNEEGRSRCR